MDMKAYLAKRYGAVKEIDLLEQNNATKKKKKQKKKEVKKEPTAEQGLRIIDEDAGWQREIRLDVEENDDEIAPVIVETEEDIQRRRLEMLTQQTLLKIGEDGGGWVEISPGLSKPKTEASASSAHLSPVHRDAANGQRDLPSRRQRHDSPDLSPSRRQVKQEDLSPPRRGDSSPRRARHDSPDLSRVKQEVLSPPRTEKQDLSPPRRARHDSPDKDLSPPRRGRHDSPDKDLSPPRRRGRHDSPDKDLLPPRRARHDSPEKDLSPPRRARHDSPDKDLSPPRRGGRHDSPDLSPPRRRARHDSPDSSPPRRGKQEDLSPPRRGRDLSPPRRRGRHDSPDSSPRRQGKQENGDLSPRRRRTKRDSPDSSPRRRKRDLTPERTKQDAPAPRKKTRHDSPGKAGLKTGRDILEELQRKQEEEAKRFQELDASITGRGAETVYRDKHGRKMTYEELMKQRQGPPKPVEKKIEWGSGLAQKREAEKQREELEAEKDKPFARTKADLDEIFKNRVRWGDPMAHLVKNAGIEGELEDFSKDEQMRESGFNVPQDIPAHSWIKRRLPAALNRYNIRPGRHWDGVDRSNGFEEKMFKQQNEKKALLEDAYKWSVADM